MGSEPMPAKLYIICFAPPSEVGVASLWSAAGVRLCVSFRPTLRSTLNPKP